MDTSGGFYGRAPGKALGLGVIADLGPASTDSYSDCQPCQQQILDKLELGLIATRIRQNLVVEHD